MTTQTTTAEKWATGEEAAAQNTTGKKWGMVVDTRRCIGCQACTVACKSENKVPLGAFRTHVKYFESGTYPEAKRRFLPMLCMQCANPPCVMVCPAAATYKREDGIVLIDYDKCIGCGYCVDACPYDARYLNSKEVDVAQGGVSDLGARRPYGKADKCTYCAHRVAQGLVPSCVNTCVGGARQFGDMNDKNDPVTQLKDEIIAGSKQLAEVSDNYGPLELGGLSTFYILPASKADYHLPDIGERAVFNGKQLVKVVGALAAAGTIGALGVSFISTNFGGE